MKRIALGLLILVAACEAPDRRPPTAEWRVQCIESHDETTIVMMPDGNGGMTSMPITNTVCDQTGIVCMEGKDGSTKCPTQGALPTPEDLTLDTDTRNSQ